MSDRFAHDVLIADLETRLVRRTATSRTSVMGAGSDDLEAGKAYLRAVADAGYAVPMWPVEYGGMAADKAQANAVGAALGEFEIPDLYPFGIGLGIFGPTLQEVGTPEQCARFLPEIRTGNEIWCQMFSEPDAGSDLANLGTRAVRDGDEWILDGSKVWTSRGMYSRWGFCLARTDPDVPKHRGITAFIVDMESPGVDVRPLHQMNGDAHFTEVFLTGVRVPDDRRIAGVGDGWRVAITALGWERAGVASRHGGGGTNERLVKLARSSGSLADPIVRQRLADLKSRSSVAAWTAQRAVAAAKAGTPGPQGSGAKIRWGDHLRRTGQLGKDLQGADGMLVDEDWHPIFLTGPSMGIRGGTDEIQRNIVGERVLGLPVEPRVDKDVSYAEARQGKLAP